MCTVWRSSCNALIVTAFSISAHGTTHVFWGELERTWLPISFQSAVFMNSYLLVSFLRTSVWQGPVSTLQRQDSWLITFLCVHCSLPTLLSSHLSSNALCSSFTLLTPLPSCNSTCCIYHIYLYIYWLWFHHWWFCEILDTCTCFPIITACHQWSKNQVPGAQRNKSSSQMLSVRDVIRMQICVDCLYHTFSPCFLHNTHSHILNIPWP